MFRHCGLKVALARHPVTDLSASEFGSQHYDVCPLYCNALKRLLWQGSYSPQASFVEYGPRCRWCEPHIASSVAGHRRPACSMCTGQFIPSRAFNRGVARESRRMASLLRCTDIVSTQPCLFALSAHSLSACAIYHLVRSLGQSLSMQRMGISIAIASRCTPRLDEANHCVCSAGACATRDSQSAPRRGLSCKGVGVCCVVVDFVPADEVRMFAPFFLGMACGRAPFGQTADEVTHRTGGRAPLGERMHRQTPRPMCFSPRLCRSHAIERAPLVWQRWCCGRACARWSVFAGSCVRAATEPWVCVSSPCGCCRGYRRACVWCLPLGRTRCAQHYTQVKHAHVNHGLDVFSNIPCLTIKSVYVLP